jgi:hypothetical protein
MDASALRHLAEVTALWNKIEQRAKEVENFRGEAIVACINEMRYAGRRIVDIIAYEANGAKDPDFDVAENLAIAKNYLINADHDLTDAVIFFAHKRILRIVEQYGRAKICTHCTDFDSLYPSIQEAQEIIKGSRADRPKRRAEYEKLASEYLPKIMELHKRLSAIEALRVQDDAALAQVGRWVRITAALSLLGSAASIIGLGLAIWGLYLIFNPPIT